MVLWFPYKNKTKNDRDNPFLKKEKREKKKNQWLYLKKWILEKEIPTLVNNASGEGRGGIPILVNASQGIDCCLSLPFPKLTTLVSETFCYLSNSHAATGKVHLGLLKKNYLLYEQLRVFF